jgi:hypothetical protein
MNGFVPTDIDVIHVDNTTHAYHHDFLTPATLGAMRDCFSFFSSLSRATSYSSSISGLSHFTERVERRPVENLSRPPILDIMMEVTELWVQNTKNYGPSLH